MLHLKLCGRLGGCLAQVRGFGPACVLNQVGEPQCGVTLLRCNQVDAAGSDSPNTAVIIEESSDHKKPETKANKANSSKKQSFRSSKSKTLKSGNNGEKIFNIHEKKVKSHVYSSIYPWTTKNELIDVLMDSQIFDNDNLLVLNKPYGLAQVNTNSKVSYGRAPPSITLTDVMPELRQLVRAPDLKVSIAPEKWQSGVLVLTKNKKCENRITYNKRITRSMQVCMKQFWVVTRNRAYPSDRPYRLAALRSETVPSGAKVAVLEFTPSSSRVRQQLVDRFYATHSTLAESETTRAALVQVGVSRTMHHSVRVWLAHHLALPLGDHLYGGRVAYLLDNPVPVPHTRDSSQPPYPYELLKKLELVSSIQDLMPLMMHLRTVTLPRYYVGGDSNRKEQDLTCFKHSPDKHSSSETGDAQAATEADRVDTDEDDNTPLNSSSNEDHRFGNVGVDEDHQNKLLKKEGKIQIKNKTSAIKDSSTSLIFTAPVPQHFSWTMERLGINMSSD
ncbi:Pseudouridine synthase catalytic domain [Trinorchestia longiramus]|nr:Pseudouridine synthase catalytic domain [Trinorchestia longiramus]